MADRRAVGAIVAALLAWACAMCVLEPVQYDGWYIVEWLRGGGGFGDFARANWTGELWWGNPRLGQLVTYITYGTAWHYVITPLLVVAFYGLLVVHWRGRQFAAEPARSLIVIAALMALAQPQFVPVLFYRPFVANYLLAMVVILGWLVPYRLANSAIDRDRTRGAAAAMLVAGAIAGAMTEQSLPIAIAAGVVTVREFRRGRGRAWMVTGIVGFVTGYILLVTAPAQHTRYCGAGEASIIDRITDRSAAESLVIVIAPLWRGWCAWAALAVALIARRWTSLRASPVAWRRPLSWLALGFALAWVLFGSPKQGDRLLFAPLAFAIIGIADLLAQIVPRRVLTIGAALVAGGAAVWSLRVQASIADQLARRHDQLAAHPAGTVARVEPIDQPTSRWYLGDDLRSDSHRAAIANYYGLAAIEVAGEVNLDYRYQIVVARGGERRVVEEFRPLQGLCEMRRSFAETLPTMAESRQPDTVIELAIATRAAIVDRMGTPDRPLLAGVWRSGRLIAPTARIGYDTDGRWAAIEPNGVGEPYEVKLVGPDGVANLAADGAHWRFATPRPGTYWIVVCDRTACYFADSLRVTRD